MAHYKGAAAEATRAMHLLKKRERAMEELELKKRKIEEDQNLTCIDNKFLTHKDSAEAQVKSTNAGLVTLDQLRERQASEAKERDRQIARNDQDKQSGCQLIPKTSDNLKLEIKKPLINNSKSLSFGYDSDEEDDDDEPTKTDYNCDKSNDIKCKDGQKSSDSEARKTTNEVKSESRLGALSKLDVDTSLLPDCEREEEEKKLREKLAAEWREAQQKLKEEEIEITFSFWDGSGHRRQVKMKKGDSIYQFLQACLDTLRKDFNELRKVSADQLMYVKEDLIIPHHYTFYDFIVTKARGKSGPLFSFDVHDDIRLMNDARVEKDESHAGKVLLRSWYERNKHIFPASRWEPYDPTKSYDKYTISDKRTK